MENLQVTAQGLAAALSAADMGLKLKLTRFRLGTGTGYTPDTNGLDTDLQGTVVHTAPISGYTLEGGGQLKMVLRLPAEVGTFTFGELAIDAETSPGVFMMFASAVLPSPLTKESSLSASAPSTFTFNCYIKLEQGNSIIQVVPGDVNAGGADYSAQIYNLQQQINNIGTPSNFQPQIDSLNTQVTNLSLNLANKPNLATYVELNSPTPPANKAVAANHLLNKAGDNLLQLTPGGLYLPQSAIGGGGGGGGSGQPTITLPAILTRADNQVVASGIVAALSLELGDVVQVELSGQGNNKLFTVTTITDANTLKFNERHALHAAGVSLKKLANESGTLKFTRIAKWYNAAIGLGQSWCTPTSALIWVGAVGQAVHYGYLTVSSYAAGTNLVNTTNRTSVLGITFSQGWWRAAMRIDGLDLWSSPKTPYRGGGPTSDEYVTEVTVPTGSTLNLTAGDSGYTGYIKYRELS